MYVDAEGSVPFYDGRKLAQPSVLVNYSEIYSASVDNYDELLFVMTAIM